MNSSLNFLSTRSVPRRQREYRKYTVQPIRAHNELVLWNSRKEEAGQLNEQNMSPPDQFNWFRNWWPVQAVGNLETDRPNKITLLGKDFIVWKSHSGNWIAMDDQCPHRMAPLSEGRIESDGNLLCSYHAWRFNELGKCVKIPQAENKKAHFVACNSPRSAVRTYPCKARGSLLWIWPDLSSSAFTDSNAAPLFIEGELADYLERANADGLFYPYTRFLPYSFDVLMENLVDPSHFTVSHHGLNPSISRYNSRPIYARAVEGLGPRPVLEAMEYSSINSFFGQSHFEIEAPGAVFLYPKSKPGNPVTPFVVFAAVPINTGSSMLIIVDARDKKAFEENRIYFLQKLKKRMMVWVRHVFVLDKVFDGDTVLLHGLDEKLKACGTDFKHNKRFFTPTSADLLSNAFRKWFENEGNYGAAYGSHKSIKIGLKDIRKEQLFDRYELHIKHCKVCSQALLTINRIVSFFKFLFVTSVVIGSHFLLKNHTGVSCSLKTVFKSFHFLLACLLAMISAVGVLVIDNKILPHFRFMDHVHADLD
eukprot:g8940.t1